MSARRSSSPARPPDCLRRRATTAPRSATSPALGVQKGSLYAHIASKQDLLYETLREGAAAFHAALDAVPEEAPVEQIRLALRGHLRVVAEQLDVATVFVRSGATSRASAGRSSSPSGGGTSSGSATSSARAATSASSAPTSTTALPRCSLLRPRTGPTPGSSRAATPTSSPTASSPCSSTACAATPPR